MSKKLRKFVFKTLPRTEMQAGVDDSINYQTLLGIQLGLAGANGVTVAQIMERMKLIELVKGAEDFVLLEENAHAQITKDLKNERWSRVTTNLVQFVSDFENAEVVDSE